MLITHEAIMAEVEYRQLRLRRDYGPVGRPRWWPRRRRRGDPSAGQAPPPPPVAAPHALPEPEPVHARQPVAAGARLNRA